MPRGGKREGAGRKSTWVSGRKVEQTTLIRVPEEFAEQLLLIAHKLDSGETFDFLAESLEEEFLDLVTESNQDIDISSFDSVTKSETESQQEEVLSKGKQLELLKDISNSTDTVLFLSSVELAKRLNTNGSTISKHKLGKRQPSLPEWTKKKDPQGISWEYCEENKKYKPVS